MRMVGVQRNDPTPRRVLKLDAAGRAVAQQTIKHPKGHGTLENPLVPEAPRTIGSRARAGIERLYRERQRP